MKNVLIHVTRQPGVVDSLYCQGLSITSDGLSIDFALDFSVNASGQGITNQNADSLDLESDLIACNPPSLIQIGLTKRTFDAAYRTFKNYVDLYNLKPVKTFVAIQANHKYRLPCRIQSDEHNMIALSILDEA